MIIRLKNLAVLSCLVLALTACAKPQMVPGTNRPVGLLEPDLPTAPVIRQPVLPELLVACRGHVLVPSLGMTLFHAVATRRRPASSCAKNVSARLTGSFHRGRASASSRIRSV